ncbi:GNAT family N-acetyltransferase [Sphingomonas xinjiangensis]|uniref:CelD/BcsL family acetyltransferase involved in cellulose biosynthesis n=1 Tax=Sphingomonas xinjiangensis TaxID=643568 RepID=A0A840YMR6_9SPHN|nr:GNAT family N-acetyltransferase [Sphingomonas xinjiangensis]MBB5710990.1 CelD/BcsL family acetyltransferase involved in cellulose biosynthesis [Sphingomonas xinjiangensis]
MGGTFICERAAVDDPVVADAWDALAKTAGTANPFYGRKALAACLDLPEAQVPQLLLVRHSESGALAGLLPVATRRKRGVAVCVENWDQRVRALGEPLVHAGAERNFWRAALPVLARMPGQYLRLSALDGDSPSTLALLTVLRDAGRSHYVTRDYGRAVLNRGLSSEAHAVAHVRPKVLKEHRRLRARLGEHGALSFERLAPRESVDPWIDTLFELEATGWKGREGVAANADPATERCFRTILHAANRAGTLDFHRMRVGDRTIAMLANLERGDEAFQLKIAFDEDWARYSPGVLIEMEYLRHALDVRDLRQVDSCARADHPMINRIWPDRRRIVSLAIPFESLGSRLLCAAMARMRQRADGSLTSTTAG